MLNFVVCEDNKIFKNKIEKMIYNYMMNYDTKYKIYTFNDYNDEFYEFAKKEIGFKIYFLDIKTNTSSGLDAARMIREQYNDWSSMITVVTAYPEYRYEALCSRLFILDFINKLDECDRRLKESLEISMANYKKKNNSLCYKYNSDFNVVEFKDIICIEKEQDSKRCIIHTVYGDELIPKTLTQLNDFLDTRFFKTHRSLIVNVEYIKKYEYRKNRIVFKNNEHTHLISREKRKELMAYVANRN